MADEQRPEKVSRRRFLGSTALTAGATLGAWRLPFGTGTGRALAQPRMAAGAITPRLFAPGEFLVSTNQQYTPTSDARLLLKELDPLTKGLVRVLGIPNSFAGQPPQLSPLRIYNIGGQPSIVHYLIRNSQHLPNANPQASRQALDVVTTLFNLLKPPQPSTDLISLGVRDVNPVWTGSSSGGDGMTVGGPGGLPIKTSSSITRYRFPTLPTPPGAAPAACALGAASAVLGTSTAAQVLYSPMCSSVKVWIFDTCPESSAVKSSLKFQNPAVRIPATWPNAVAPSDEHTWWAGIWCEPTAPHKLADHGLFAAGLVNQVAPNSELVPVRVLNDYCAGTVGSILQGLMFITPTGNKPPAVVNMSLTVSVPTTQQQLDEARTWLADQQLPTTALDIWYSPQGFDDPIAGAKASTSILHASMQALAESNVFVVAAAGNDGNAWNHGAPSNVGAPRVPALYDDICLSVAAVDHLGHAAPYTNSAAAAGNTNGIATFGGSSTCGAFATDPMIGLYSAYTDPMLNQQGMAYWVGTSFATPLISGLTANFLANNTGTTWTPYTLMTALQGLPGMSNNAQLRCKVLTAS